MSELNARQEINQLWHQLIDDALMSEPSRAKALRELDALLADFVQAVQVNAYMGHFQQLVDRAKALGYSNDA